MSGFYCWRCYAVNDLPAGPCRACRQEIAEPAGATSLDRAVWGLGHPDPDVAIMATRRLGGRSEPEAVRALHGVLDHPPDPYVAAVALRSLVRIEGADKWRGELQRLAHCGPALLRRTALSLLAPS